MKKDYKVSMTVTSTHVYRVTDCNSPEEATSIAEEWFADGEEGMIEDTDVDSIDAVVDEEEDES
jgi:hypothetical protein